MRREMKTAAIALLALLSAAACTRRVQVESEPSRMEASAASVSQPGLIDIVGSYDYVVPLDNGEDATGRMTITRVGDSYAVAFAADDGEVTGRNVRRTGNTLRMDVSTPGGEGSAELTWLNRDQAAGTVFLGETLELRVTRRS